MLETLHSSYKSKNALSILDISFDDAVLGTKTIVDKAQGIVLPLVPNSTGTGYGVVDVAGVGRCYQFDGIHFFYNANDVLGNFNVDSYDIEFGYIRPGTNLTVMFCTGEHADGKGTSMSTHSFSGSYLQAFRINQAGVYQREVLSGNGVTTFTEIIVQKRKSGTTIKNKTTGQVQTFPNFDTGGNSYLSIGAQRTGNYGFSGYLKYLRIKKVIE